MRTPTQKFQAMGFAPPFAVAALGVIVSAWVAGSLWTGCGGGGGSGSGAEVDLTGIWNGWWFSRSGPSGRLSADVTHQNNSLSGLLGIHGSPCLSNANISGTATRGSLTFGAVSGQQRVQFSGTYQANWVTGTYSVESGECMGDEGSFSLSKGGALVTTLVSGIGFIPPQYSTAFPLGAHMVVQGGNVFWYEGATKSLKKTPVSGDQVTTLASGFKSDFAPLAADSHHVYVADSWTVKRVSLEGGPVEELAVGDFYIEDLATDGDQVYWVEQGPSSIVRKVPVQGGAVQTLGGAGGPAGRIRVEGDEVFWIGSPFEIHQVSRNGGSVTPVLTDLPYLEDFIVDGASIFLSEEGGRIERASIHGGDRTTLLDGSPWWSPYFLAVSPPYLYWVNQQEVGKIDLTGGPPTVIFNGVVAGAGFADSIAVDETSVYWTEMGAGAIKKTTPR